MVYTYSDFLPFMTDLKKYVRSKVKTDSWKDVVQDTMVCLYMRFDRRT
jgi:DNA-directed RNA polymerase specialized sigma24 family protein